MEDIANINYKKDNPDNGFGHIKYDDWKIGFEYEKPIKGKVEYLDEVISKELEGRPYDQDILITFSKNGKQYKHIIEFDYSYRIKIIINLNN